MKLEVNKRTGKKEIYLGMASVTLFVDGVYHRDVMVRGGGEVSFVIVGDEVSIEFYEEDLGADIEKLVHLDNFTVSSDNVFISDFEDDNGNKCQYQIDLMDHSFEDKPYSGLLHIGEYSGICIEEDDFWYSGDVSVWIVHKEVQRMVSGVWKTVSVEGYEITYSVAGRDQVLFIGYDDIAREVKDNIADTISITFYDDENNTKTITKTITIGE